MSLQDFERICRETFEENSKRTKTLFHACAEAEKQVPLSPAAEEISELISVLNSITARAFTSGVNPEQYQAALDNLIRIRNRINELVGSGRHHHRQCDIPDSCQGGCWDLYG